MPEPTHALRRLPALSWRPGASASRCSLVLAAAAEPALLNYGYSLVAGELLQMKVVPEFAPASSTSCSGLSFSFFDQNGFRNALVGFTGSGKSSNVNLVAKLYLATLAKS